MEIDMNYWRTVLDASFGSMIQNCLQYPDNYWQQGCAFDTVLDYLQYSIQTASAENREQKIKDAQNTVRNVYINVYEVNKLGGEWYDDWAWWGIAATKAYDPAYADVFGGSAENFKAVAQFCYDTMVTGKGRNEKGGAQQFYGAQNVWATCDQTRYSKVKPRFPGGSWQNDFPAAADQPGPLDPKNPLGFYQVSVMNGLFLVFASQLATQTRRAAADADAQYMFIQDWIKYRPTPDQGLVNTDNAIGALIRERVSSYASGDFPVSAYKPATCWGGDQGLFIGGLLAYEKYNPTDATKALIRNIVTGVGLRMSRAIKGETVYPNVMWPWYPFDGNVLAEIDAGDYSSGSGVFMRYFLLAYKKCPEFILKLLGDPSTGLVKMLVGTANYYANAQAPVVVDKTPPIFMYFNQMSALLTVLALSEGADWSAL